MACEQLHYPFSRDESFQYFNWWKGCSSFIEVSGNSRTLLRYVLSACSDLKGIRPETGFLIFKHLRPNLPEKQGKGFHI
jgi:hypothetical protein